MGVSGLKSAGSRGSWPILIYAPDSGRWLYYTENAVLILGEPTEVGLSDEGANG